MFGKKNTHPVSEDMDKNERYFYDHTKHLAENQQCFNMEDRVAFLYILARRHENPRVTNKEILSLSMNDKVKAYMLRDHMLGDSGDSVKHFGLFTVERPALSYLKKEYVKKILSICPEYSIEQAASAPTKPEADAQRPTASVTEDKKWWQFWK